MVHPQPARVFLITGASSGIGVATAHAAAQAGYQLVVAGRSAQKLQMLVDALGASAEVLAVCCDTTKWNEQEALVAAARDRFGRIDVVYANSGVITGAASFLSSAAPPEAWQEMIMTNIYGTALTVRALLPELIKTRGHLLLTGSVLGRVVMSGSLYGATKWAITGMAESIRQELRGTGVRVTLIAPGQVATSFGTGRIPVPTAAAILSADDVARAVLYAVSQPPHVDVNEVLLRPVGAEL